MSYSPPRTHTTTAPMEGTMSHVTQGTMLQGGLVTIQFPHMRMEVSCDSEVELKQCIEMLRKAFELYQYDEAKKAITAGAAGCDSV